jgi:hypothetical protein
MSKANRFVELKCMAGKGMFPHEASVLIRGASQCYESLIDWEFLQLAGGTVIGEEDVLASIPVQVVQDNGDNLLVELPRQVVSGGRRIWVPKTEVEDGDLIAAGDRS